MVLIVLIIDYVYCLLVFVVVVVVEIVKIIMKFVNVGLNLWFIGGICDICYFGVVFI